ncbi:MAG: ATP-binding protein [Armatimonadetes bacterium]|nr:ATP-binding protein [Armatimonadota bacterium]
MAVREFTIAVAAGKGGTGKTLLSTSLALALAQAHPNRVQLVDCDAEEPNAHLLLPVQVRHERTVKVRVARVLEARCTACGRCAAACQFGALALMRRRVAVFPALCIGCGTCAFVCPESAMLEEERVVGSLLLGRVCGALEFTQGRIHVGEQRVTPVLQALRKALAPGMIRVLDAPPGTACPMQETISGADACLLVTEPTPFGCSDLTAAVETCRALGVPCSVVINRTGVGERSVYDYCAREGIPVLLEIPWRRAIAEAYARGGTLLDADPAWADSLRTLFRQTAVVAERR